MVDDVKLTSSLGRCLVTLAAHPASPWCASATHSGCTRRCTQWRHDLYELAQKAGVNERYLREWLSHQAASNYLSYDPATGTFALPPEQAMVFAVEDSPLYMLGGFDMMATLIDAQPKVQEAFKTGNGVAWSDHTGCMFCAVARFFRPGYHNHLVAHWLPALDGVVAKLQRGAEVADVGCGHGWSTVMMAKAFPNSSFVGYDFHPSSIEHARAHAKDHGVTANTRFEVATAKEFPAPASTS